MLGLGVGFTSPAVLWVGGGGAAGGAALLTDEANGFAADFTYATDAQRVAVKASSTTTEYAVDAFFANAGTSPKLVTDAAGTLVWSPHNMLLQSENFSLGWTMSGTPIVTAHTLQDDDPAVSEIVVQSVASVVGETYTFTAWFLKDAVTSRFPAMGIFGTLIRHIHINTQTGAIAAETATMPGSQVVVDAGTHWQVSITVVIDHANPSLRLYPARGTVLGTVNIAAVGTVTVDKTQYNRGPVPTAYLPTTSAARYGLAIDYDPSTTPPTARGLLVEPAATNLVQSSEGLSDAWWTATQGTSLANQTTAPDGRVTADKFTENGTNNSHILGRVSGFAVANGSTYTWSIYAKPAGRTWLVLYDVANTNTGAWFNLSGAGIVGTRQGLNSRAVVTALPNGWYRCEVTYAASTAFGGPHVALATGDTVFTYVGDGASGAYLWGAQFELGSVATSPIPTYAASATRAAENVTFLLSAIPALGSTYSIYERFQTPTVNNAQYAVALTDGTTNEISGIKALTGASLSVVDGGVAQAAITIGTLVANTAVSASMSVQANDVGGSVAGSAVTTDATATLPTLTEVRFGGVGSNAATAATFRVEKLVIVPRAWSDAELTAKSAT